MQGSSEQDLDNVPVRDKKAKNQELSLIRQKFQLYLGKLTTIETKDVGLKEIQHLIINNNESKHLRVYLSVLAEHKRPLNYTSNEQEVLVIGYLCSVYRDRLLDPLDQPPSLQKSAYRVIELILKYFKDPNPKVQEACAKSWKEVYKNVLLNEDLQIRILILYETIASLINSGTDRISQETSTIVLDEFLSLLLKMNEMDMLVSITQQFLPQIYFKTQIDHPSMPRCLKHILAGIHIKNLINFSQQIIDKIIFFLTTNKKPEVPYKTKIECCECLEILAIQYQEIETQVIGSFHNQILPVLLNSCRDRILKVQNAAKSAQKEWLKFKQNYEKLEYLKRNKQAFNENLDIDQIIEHKTKSDPKLIQLNFQNNENKEEKGIRVVQHESDMRKMMAEQGGWVKETRGRNFQRKQSGTGGGQTVNANKKTDFRSKSRDRNSIKEMIMKQGVQPQNKLNNIEFIGHHFNLIEENQSYYPIQNVEVLPINQHMVQEDQKGDKNLQGYRQQGGVDNYQNWKHNKLTSQTASDQLYQQNKQKENKLSYEQAYNQRINDKLVQLSLQQQKNDKQLLHKPQYQIPFYKTDGDQLKNYQQNTNYKGKLEEYQHFNEQEDELEQTMDFNSNVFQKKEKINPEIGQNQAVQNANKNTQSLSIWEEALRYIEQGDFNSAYSSILDTGDDLYLLRLMMITGKCIGKLSRPIAVKVINKYVEIMKSKFLQKLCIDFYQDSLDKGFAKSQPIEDNKQVVGALYEMSGEQSEIGQRASELYNQYISLQ